MTAQTTTAGNGSANHHSSDSANNGRDTGPMSLVDMTAWFEARGAGQPGMATTAELIKEHYGKTEAELDQAYDVICGPTT